MKKLALLIMILCAITQAKSQKRGIAYGHHSPEDLQVLSPAVSWWYNWSVEPESSVANVFGNYGFGFVPMCWNGNYSETNLRNFLQKHPETRYLLAFNEPNFIDQANMTPSEVAARWPALEAIADEYNLKIVAPAVNYCGNCVSENGTTYTDPFDYLDDFFKVCPTCRVDYIAVHCYMNTVPALQWYIDGFKKYNRPIWLTEFDGWEDNGNINRLNDQINFMMGAVDFLESDPDVFRYSWFIGRGSGSATYPFIDLLGANGQLTALGEVYKAMPVHDPKKVVALPARIEAEAYNTQQGFRPEQTVGDDGFAHLAYTDAGDWVSYEIDVPESGDYTVSFRYAANKASSLEMAVDGHTMTTINLNATGGWQNWQTTSGTSRLQAGQHTLQLTARTSGFNLNWVEFSYSTATAIGEINAPSKHITLFPNPAHGEIGIESDQIPLQSLELYSLDGQLLRNEQINAGNTYRFSLEPFKAGIYLLKINHQITKKLIVF